MRRGIQAFIVVALLAALLPAQSLQIQFIFTSDSHYGITRASFRGAANVDAHVVNGAMVAQMNRMPEFKFPADGGIRSGQAVGAIDFVVDGGDVANRAEITDEGPVQNAAASWSQFRQDYIEGLNLLARTGMKIPFYVVPGNHDASNAVGSYKPMMPLADKTSMMQIYNLMAAPAVPRTLSTFDYEHDKVLASHDAGGLHFMYVQLWPDTLVRQWMDADLKRVSATTPVIVFAHDPPDSDAKHFKNPNGKHDINDVDRYENLLIDVFADANGSRTSASLPLIEQRAWENFLQRHPNITGYFHGHENWNQFYDWTGPDHTVVLHTFRVDSPMKGRFSAADETKLSFQIASVDMASRTITVREVLWNADPRHPDAPVAWGASTTVALAPRSAAKR